MTAALLRPYFLGLSLAALVAMPLRAQNGDKAGETQPARPAHLVVPPAPNLTPAEELRTFKLPPGFHAELVAADPLVMEPVTMLFAPDGRIWVVEMMGYMQTVDGDGEKEPTGRVVILADTDGDGRMDKRTVFADKLVLPRAIALVDDGVLVAEPPKLWYLRDANHDDVADAKKEITSDYGGAGNMEHLPNGLMWGLDNWIYSANYTARLKYQGDGVFVSDSTFSRGQWGISQDDTGRVYHNSNSDPLRFDAINHAYLKRNPNFAAEGANVQLVPADLPVYPNRVTSGINRGYRTLDKDGKEYAVTSACGPVVYRGTLFPADFRGDAFLAEPSGNLVKRIKLGDQGGVLRGANAYTGTEFLTSTDERFRPVNVFNGPDGGLYVVDMYRGIIQDHFYVTSYLRKEILERGLDKPVNHGRIWRIVPDGAPKLNLKLTLATATPTDLVKSLADPNGWTRDTAQRLLVEKRVAAHTPAVAAALRELATKGDSAVGRLHALWTLDGSGVLDQPTLLGALNDRDSRVVAGGIRLAEGFFGKPGGEAVAERVIGLVASRPESDVRLQLALSLTEIKTPAADEALRKLVNVAGRQPYLADAVVSGLGGRELPMIEALLKDPQSAGSGTDVLRYAASSAIKSGNTGSIDRVFALAAADATPEWGRSAILGGVRHFLPKTPDGRAVAGKLPAEPKPLLALAEGNSPSAPVAKQLVNLLNWPGKPGTNAAPVRPLNAAEQALFETGKAQFAMTCAACHQPNGQGLAGLAPSLIFSRWILGDPRVLARIVLNGKTQQNLIMPPWKGILNDEAIAGVLTFVRRSWGHEADPVDVATVAEARKAMASRDEPWNDADLEELVKELK